MICAMVICALLVGGNGKQCDIAQPVKIEDHETIKSRAECGKEFERRKTKAEPGERFMLIDMIPPRGWRKQEAPDASGD